MPAGEPTPGHPSGAAESSNSPPAKRPRDVAESSGAKHDPPAPALAAHPPPPPAAAPSGSPHEAPPPPPARRSPGAPTGTPEPAEETLLQRCKRLKRDDIIHKRNEAAAQEAERAAQEAGLNDPMKGYRPKRPPMTPFPADLARLEARIAQVKQQVTKLESEMRVKDDTKTVSLGTSKVNYIDPRIVTAWCKRYEVPIEKVFAKTLINKFPWALDVDPAYRFQRALDPTASSARDPLGADDSESGEDSD